jgi:hypothetical protein
MIYRNTMRGVGSFLRAIKKKWVGCQQNDTVDPCSVGDYQYLERKDNEGFDGRVGQIV